MIRKKILASTLLILCSLPAAALATTRACPDYLSALHPPPLVKPAKRSFRHLGNQLLSWFNSPYHMVHDQIVREGEPAVIVAKFDYGSIAHKDLEDEDVHVYLYGTGMLSWQYLGEHRTDSDGKIHVPVTKGVGEYRVVAIVEGDHSSASGYVSVVEPGRQAVLFDIDGTLTLSDFEIVGDYLGVSTAAAYDAAVDVVNTYAAKGYQIVYLTGRPYWVAKDTREWFDEEGFLGWHLRTDPYGDGPIPPDTEGFKIDYLTYLLDEVGLDIVRAYGNATTDISAYEAVGLPKSETYVIGTYAGEDGTQPISGGYGDHYDTVVLSTPDADCI